jgi:aminoglycoside 2'-N-acetyltransferase I
MRIRLAPRAERAVTEQAMTGDVPAELRILHTADLDAAMRSAIRGLMDAAFDSVSDDTYENVLGGMHTLVLQDGDLIGHASVVQRRMLHNGKALRTGYIEGVAVRADRRRRGHGEAMMAELERYVRYGYELGALGASQDGSRLYTSRGWQLWRGPVSAMTADGIRRTPRNDGSIYVLPVSAPLDLDGELTCDWRPASVW